jgi:hypothetical protein
MVGTMEWWRSLPKIYTFAWSWPKTKLIQTSNFHFTDIADWLNLDFSGMITWFSVMTPLDIPYVTRELFLRPQDGHLGRWYLPLSIRVHQNLDLP